MDAMRLPQSIFRPLSFPFTHSLTFAIVLVISMPTIVSASTPQLACSPSSLRFGEIATDQTESLLVTLTNNGDTSATLSGISVDNSAFVTSSIHLPMTLDPGQSVDLNVSFTPKATGWTSGTVSFTSNASNPTLSLDVHGTGVASQPLTANPTALSFGSVATGSKSTLPLVVTNDRSYKVAITSLEITGSTFSFSGATFPITLDAGQSLSFNATFSPQSTGEVGGSVFLEGPAITIPLTGTGAAATQYSVNLSWNSSEDVEGYNVYRSTSANGTYSKINSTLDANTAYTDSSVIAGQTYYYEATSVNNSGSESPRSTPAVVVAIP